MFFTSLCFILLVFFFILRTTRVQRVCFYVKCVRILINIITDLCMYVFVVDVYVLTCLNVYNTSTFMCLTSGNIRNENMFFFLEGEMKIC